MSSILCSYAVWFDGDKVLRIENVEDHYYELRSQYDYLNYDGIYEILKKEIGCDAIELRSRDFVVEFKNDEVE